MKNSFRYRHQLRHSLREALSENGRFSITDTFTCYELHSLGLCELGPRWSSTASTGNLVRMICPRTCGCANPLLGQHFASRLYGCPSMCETPYQEVLASTPCIDQPSESLGFLGFYDGIVHENGMAVAPPYEYLYLAAKHPLKVGPQLAPSQVPDCTFWNSTVLNWVTDEVFVCDDNDLKVYDYVNLRALCPMTCGCQLHGGAGCPASCSPRTTR